MPTLKSLIRPGELLVAPGIFDGISARLANQFGFKALYMTGYGTVASHLGLPDAGLASYADMVGRVKMLSGTVSAPLIADGDTGYGGLLNVQHTVRGYEDAGAAAIQIEDQEVPKKCGHTPDRRVIPLDDMTAKIKVAAESRDSSDFLIVARTDSRTKHGLDEALHRAEAFVNAGADILFVEAPESIEEMERIGKTFDAPLLVNVVEGGKTPVLSRQEYIDLGYSVAIYPAAGFLAMGAALKSVYGQLSETGSSIGAGAPLEEFMTFSRAMGFEEVWDFEREHATEI